MIKRSDDDVSVLRHRLEEFNSKTQPLAAFYEKTAELHRIDGNRERDAGLRRHFASDRAGGMIPIKTAKEVEKMRQACRTASEILERVSDWCGPGFRPRKWTKRPRT